MTLTKPRLAIEGGPPVRTQLLPYGRQWIDDTDIEVVVQVLRSDWLTTGPAVEGFERAVASAVGASDAVAVSNGTAALHAAMHAIGIGPGDEVIVPAITFVATANAVVFQGGTPIFADVDPERLLIDPAQVGARISSRTKAIVAVDYAGHPCDYDALRAIANRHGLALVADGCHSLGGTFKSRPVGTLADLTAFSFHPVKHITTGEGGMITTNDPALAGRMRRFRNHGLDSDHRQRSERGAFAYEMVELGYNYRLTDFQCALGLSQVRRLPEFVRRRQAIAQRYDRQLGDMVGVDLLRAQPEASHAYHLYAVLLQLDKLSVDRAAIFGALRSEGIGVNVHYLPVHLHAFYRERYGTKAGMCPVAEAAYARLLSLPMFPHMDESDVTDVIAAMEKVTSFYAS